MAIRRLRLLRLLVVGYHEGLLSTPKDKLRMPFLLALAVGLVSLSLLAACAVAVHLAPWVWLPALVGLALLIRRSRNEDWRPQADRVTLLLVLCAVALYGAMYVTYVFSPEIQSDALTYHLTLLKQGFLPRITFYNVLPQGMEALFASTG